MDLFYEKKRSIDYIQLSEWLEIALSDDLRLEFEEESTELKQVSTLLIKLYEECMENNFVNLNLLLRQNTLRDPTDIIWGGLKPTEFPPKEEEPPQLVHVPPQPFPQPQQQPAMTNQPDDDEDMDISEEEEGWTKVKGRKKK
uniref:Uncharacterized protein n=1 Tax=Arcella intermedia TaxID=1963864 RepID=A0A6B2LK93_9EUKA